MRLNRAAAETSCDWFELRLKWAATDSSCSWNELRLTLVATDPSSKNLHVLQNKKRNLKTCSVKCIIAPMRFWPLIKNIPRFFLWKSLIYLVIVEDQNWIVWLFNLTRKNNFLSSLNRIRLKTLLISSVSYFKSVVIPFRQKKNLNFLFRDWNLSSIKLYLSIKSLILLGVINMIFLYCVYSNFTLWIA